MASIDDLKSLASVKLGFARPNNFLITLPARHGVDGRELNILCSNTSLPGKQVLTTERRIGMEMQKIAYGYAVDDVSMTFYLMNDYGVKKYFDNWRSKVINENTFDAQYKNEYVDDITIHQLRKPLVGFSKQLSNVQSIRVMASDGREILLVEDTGEIKKLDVDFLSQGIYYVDILSGNDHQILRFIKE